MGDQAPRGRTPGFSLDTSSSASLIIDHPQASPTTLHAISVAVKALVPLAELECRMKVFERLVPDKVEDIIQAFLPEAHTAIVWGCGLPDEWDDLTKKHGVTPDRIPQFVSQTLEVASTTERLQTDPLKSPHASSIIALLSSELDSIPARRRWTQPPSELYKLVIFETLDLQPNSFYGPNKDALAALLPLIDEKRLGWYKMYGIF
ncbi:hypothetical protein BOTBODRAFT_173531 [Botryobasidium botryosum FD-172 SS1]|uniref:Uncharacterized protein n=1 Tax=Botryobasidium botryosum (strain FD-172 SS1) TaxID=930990 RepID=A0A067MVJ5_BOTB1|nr:hypothetical protein BOTBODRAFT_173531 [Botryobasidium botryosum FD-172 SS1]